MARDSASRANNPSPDVDPTTNSGAAQASPASDDRSGQDERRRGWFWHWNGIVTQYTPLIGLKGIGLLNSYTVWTDRREDSPHRGYAFPSQQSEANFYGEDRAELITINKILVALDLIEIRKEMVRKTDEKGRRWKVPQNLYRVKDRQDGLDLTAADVLRVVELADKDKAVYRYVRKIFSSRFEPIDRNNIWHSILTELADNLTWQKLAAKAAKQEARASARTKAGHRSRARQQDASTTEEEAAPSNTNEEIPPEATGTPHGTTRDIALMTDGHDSRRALVSAERRSSDGPETTTTVDRSNNGSVATDDKSNNGFDVPAEPGNNGLSSPERGSVASANNGCESSVEPGNTMYYQSPSTTTTTTTSAFGNDHKSSDSLGLAGSDEAAQPVASREDSERSAGVATDRRARTQAEAGRDIVDGDAGASNGAAQPGLDRAAGGGPLGDPSPLALSLYEAANDRPATRLERILLSELETDAAAPAAAAGSAGPEWVAAALREAVGSGSAFVAPKRIREIINRWAAAGAGPRGPGLDEVESQASTDTPRSNGGDKHTRDKKREGNSRQSVVALTREDAAQGDRLWGVVLDMLAVDSGGDSLLRLRGVVPLGEREDCAFVLGAPTRTAARLLESRYRQPVEQALSSLLPSPVTIAVLTPDQWTIDA